MKPLEMMMRKLVLALSVAQIFPKKINKMLSLNNLGFINVLSIVVSVLDVTRNIIQVKPAQKSQSELQEKC